MTQNNPSSIHEETDSSGTSRRSFTAALLAAGFSLGTALGVTSDDVAAAERDEVPIVIGYSNEEESGPNGEHKKLVPARWYDRLTEARREYRKFLHGNPIAGRYAASEAVRGIWVSAGSIDGQRPYLELEVTDMETTPLGYLESNGVPVEVTRVERADEAPPEPTGEREPVAPRQSTRQPGQTIGDGDGYIGTLGAPVRDSSGGDWHFMACEHIGDGFGEGDSIYTSGSSYASEIGEVVDANCSDDFAIAEPSDGWEPSRAISDEGGTEVGGAGQYSLDGLADLEENGEEVKKSGQTTGITSGEVETHDGTYWVDRFSCPRRTNQLRWGDEDAGDSGDSGAPVYTQTPSGGDWFWIAAAYHATRPDHVFGGDFVHGTSAWVLTEDHGWQFY